MIPKVIHMSWKDKAVVDSQSPIILNGLRNIIDLNPDWEVQISTDDEVDQYLKDNLASDDYKLIEDVCIVGKTDIWRLIKIFKEGGVYIDIDRLCNIPLSEAIPVTATWVLPTCEDLDFSHDFMASAADNPIFAEVIKLYLDRRRAGHTGLYFLGAQTYMHAITNAFFGLEVHPNPGTEAFNAMRLAIAEIPFIKVYRESLPNNSIIYKGDITKDMWEDMKRSFYAENGIKHWSGEW